MLRNIIRWFNPPIFDDDEKTRLARILNYLLLIIILLLSTLFVILSITSGLNANSILTLSALLIALTTGWLLLKQGYLTAASIGVVIFGVASIVNLIGGEAGEGVRDPAIYGFIIVIIIANVLLGWKASASVTLASVISLWFFVYLETSGRFTPQYATIDQYAIVVTFLIVIGATLLYLLDTGLRNTARRARADAHRLELSNEELQSFQEDLEQRVAKRTEELERSSAQTQKRASQLEAIADVASSVVSLQDVDQLLPHITKTVSNRFGYYHIGIFLLSENSEYAVLRASNSEGGQAMLARQHQLRIGEEGIVGYTADQKQARIALDVGEDATYFDNPDLPTTRSEMALPLMFGGKIIGVLDVQSKESSAFFQEDIEVLTVLANQIAVAIENARLFQQSQDALQELDSTFQRYLSNEWSRFSDLSDIRGYRARQSGIEAINEPLQKDSKLINEDFVYNLPVKLRDIVIGNLDVNLDKPIAQYSEDELEIIQATVDRFAMAVENARLLEETTRRAGRERLVSEITTKIRSTNNPQVMIQTALDELKEALGASNIELTPQIPEARKTENHEENMQKK